LRASVFDHSHTETNAGTLFSRQCHCWVCAIYPRNGFAWDGDAWVLEPSEPEDAYPWLTIIDSISPKDFPLRAPQAAIVSVGNDRHALS